MPTLAFINTTDRNLFFRQVIITPDELVCSSALTVTTPGQAACPKGVFDLPSYVRSLPSPWNNPSLIVTFLHADGVDYPQNLSGIGCPRILVIGDTHHHGAVIQRAVKHALAEKYDLVIGCYNRQHLHFFLEAGVSNVAWLPSFTLSPYEYSPAPTRLHGAIFMGSSSSRHVYRNHLLADLRQRGVPITAGSGDRKFIAETISQSLVVANISLNSDMNLRLMETMAAGTCLVTDRLSPESGVELLFQEGVHFHGFRDADEAQSLIMDLLAHPERALQVARAGHAQYMLRHRPEQKIRDLFDQLHGRGPADYDPRSDPRNRLAAQDLPAVIDRMTTYETLQEIHRFEIQSSALFWPGLDRSASDAVDLPRLKITMLVDSQGDLQNSALHAAGMRDRVEWLAKPQVNFQTQRWTTLVCPESALQDPLVKCCLAAHGVKFVIITGLNLADAAAIARIAATGNMQHRVPSLPVFQVNG